MEKYAKYFDEAAVLCEELARTTRGIQLDEELQAIELYALTSISMCLQHSTTISLLLRNCRLTDCFIISRNIMEVFFNLNWASKGSTRDEINDRVFQLEANPFMNFEKEIILMENNLISSSPTIHPEFAKKHREVLDNEKNNSPFLLEDKSNLKSKFKQLSQSSFADRMGEMRIKYYHLYRFTSWFTHPTPKLKEFFMNRISNKESSQNIIKEPLKITLSYSLLFVELSFAIAKEILFDFNPESNPKRQELYNQLSVIVDNSNEGYFGIPPRN